MIYILIYINKHVLNAFRIYYRRAAVYNDDEWWRFSGNKKKKTKLIKINELKCFSKLDTLDI